MCSVAGGRLLVDDQSAEAQERTEQQGSAHDQAQRQDHVVRRLGAVAQLDQPGAGDAGGGELVLLLIQDLLGVRDRINVPGTVGADLLPGFAATGADTLAGW